MWLKAAVLLALLAPATAATQAPVARLDTVARGVYAVIREGPSGLLFESNSVFIERDSDVVAVDAQFSEYATRESLALLARATRKRVRLVILTHAHDDHVTGLNAYRKAFPGVQFLMHLATAEDLGTGYMERRRQLAAAIPPALERWRGQLRDSRTASGAPLTTGQRASMLSDSTLGRRYVDEAPSFTLVTPNWITSDRLSTRHGGRRIDVLFRGRAHTAGDLVVYLPDDGVIAAGDLIVWPVPLAGSTSYPLEYGATVDSMLALRHSVIIPGHGPVMRTDEYPALVSRLMHSLATQVTSSVARGATLEQTRAAVDLTAFRDAIAGGDLVRQNVFSTYVTFPGVARAWEQARATTHK